MAEEKGTSLLAYIKEHDVLNTEQDEKKQAQQESLHAVHEHAHTHPNKKKVLNRLARIEGHVLSLIHISEPTRRS